MKTLVILSLLEMVILNIGLNTHAETVFCCMVWRKVKWRYWYFCDRNLEWAFARKAHRYWYRSKSLDMKT